MSIINDMFQNRINSIIKQTMLSSLNKNHFDLIMNYLYQIIDDIYITFSINDPVKFQNLLLSDNHKDLKGLCLLLLPYIDTSNNYEELRKITKLDDIYHKKQINSDNIDITKEQPNYVLSNIQYSRCQRNPIKEIPFDEKFIYQNFILLKLTIQTISHRLYVNWTNIVPYTLDTYKTKKLYIDTKTIFDNHRFSDIDLTLPLPSHMYIGTMYDNIRHYLYDQIVDIKWLLYDYDTSRNIIYDFIQEQNDDNINIQPLIKILFPTDKTHERINLEKCFENIIWDNLMPDEQRIFESQWKKFINDDTNYEIIRAITYAFDNYHRYKDTIPSYIPISTDDNKKDKRTETKPEIMRSVKSIPFENVYEFLRISITKFKNTFYYHLIFGELKTLMNNKENEETIQIDGKNISIKLTPKNIYNFSKSMCHHSRQFVKLPNKWVSFNNDMKRTIIDRINNNVDQKNWFNIQKNLRKLYNVSPNGIERINDAIHNICMKNLIEIIFTSSILSGTLSEFVLDENINIDALGKGFYYLNGKKYSLFTMYDSNDTYVDNKNAIKYKKKPYISFINSLKMSKSSKSSWMSMYAMNWVSQINFFHRYLNNRVMLVTGGTGVGKSTQIPKLLLYGLKMIDYKDMGKVICSQPRRRPTREGAIRIAYEMGVTIKAGDEEEDYDETNYNIQFQSHVARFPKTKKDDSNTSSTLTKTIEYAPYPILKFVTDKILLNSITNPLYKKTYTKKSDTVLSTSNLYDIVIVDESHEHNTNMDMILTLMKNVIYYNNDCKLVIISATMDDDEPIYRRFYRNINDNKKYPLNRIIENYKLDRINVDRRLHISIPGMMTRYKINEYWGQNDIDMTEDDKNNRILEIIQNIIKNGKYGDILVFKVGQREILDCVNLLQKNTPNDVYVIPYYSEMPKTIINFIEKVNERKNELRIDKSVDITDTSIINSVEYLRNGSSHYEHIIIVATNVAEASITINTLTDVIDDGMQKVNEYRPEINGNVLQLQKISDNNRLQRKGRVGRTQDGNIHYLYTKQYLKGIKNTYKICIENITNNLFTLLKRYNDVKIFNNTNDPNVVDNLRDYSKIDQRKYIMNMDKIIQQQYYIERQLFEYIGDETQYDYANNFYGFDTYFGCFDYKSLIDVDGSFYIIHPNEMEITRNILGNIITKWTTDRINTQIERLEGRYIVLRDNLNEYVKSNYGTEVEKIMRQLFAIDDNGLSFTIACVFGKIYNCFDDIFKIITMLQCSAMSDIPLNRNIGIIDDTSDILTYRNMLNDELKNNINSVMTDKFYSNQKALREMSKKLNPFDAIISYMDKTRLMTHNYKIDDKITLAFLHSFGNNIVRRITGTKYYIALKYPIKKNIKYTRNKNTVVSDMNQRQYNLYFKMHIHDMDKLSDNEIFILHYIKPDLLKHISYQFDLNRYIPLVKHIRKEYETVDYHISAPYENEIRNIMDDVIKWNKQDRYSGDIFINISPNAKQVIYQKHKDNQKYLVGGYRKKYKIVYE